MNNAGKLELQQIPQLRVCFWYMTPIVNIPVDLLYILFFKNFWKKILIVTFQVCFSEKNDLQRFRTATHHTDIQFYHRPMMISNKHYQKGQGSEKSLILFFFNLVCFGWHCAEIQHYNYLTSSYFYNIEITFHWVERWIGSVMPKYIFLQNVRYYQDREHGASFMIQTNKSSLCMVNV